MVEAINNIENLDPNSLFKNGQDFYGEYNLAVEGIGLMQGVENSHMVNLQRLQDKQDQLNSKLAQIKQFLKESYNKIKDNPKEAINFAHLKDELLKTWNEWKEDLKTSNIDEYKNLSIELDKLDFNNLSLKDLDDKIIPELEKIQRHYEFKFQKIPNELRLFIELFSITVEILKEVPKRHDEMLTHVNRKLAGG